MKKETARTLTLIAGLVILLGVLGLGSAIWLFTRSVSTRQADKATAEAEFARVRRQFGDAGPILDIRGGDPVIVRRPARSADANLSAMHVLHWDPEDESFTRVDIPFWFLRLKATPIELGSGVGYQGELDLTVEDLERFGPAIVLDHTGRGGNRILIWTE